MRKLTTDPTGRAAVEGRDAVFMAAYTSATGGDLTESKTMRISAGKGLPQPPKKHIHHQKSSPRSKRAA